jgi:hypothetical protein
MCRCTPEIRTPFCGKPGCEWPEQNKPCAHLDFGARVDVNRLEDSGQFMADVSIHCRRCGLEFEFLGLEPGLDLQGAKVSIDGLQARLAIIPKGSKPNPLQRMAFGIRKFEA